jgi:acid phosphatase type 7
MKKRCYWLAGIGVAVVLLTLFCHNRWDAWFYNPPEPAYDTDSVPLRLLLTFGDSATLSREVSWQCGTSVQEANCFYTEANSGDTLQVAASGHLFVTAGGQCVSYHAKMDGLKKGAAYFYRVQTGRHFSEWYRFEVAAKTDSAFAFTYIGDVQDNLNGFARELLPEIVERYPTDFWVFGGDLTERPHDQYWNEFFAATEQFRPTTPIVASTGNHEYLKKLPRFLEERFVYTFPYFVSNRETGKAVFSFRYGDAVFIVLDTNRDFWTLCSQRRWFEKALKETESAKWRIVVMHHPVFSVRGKKNNVFVRRAFLPLMEKYNVDLVLAGHEHAYARRTTVGTDKMPTTPVYVISQCSPKDYRINFKSGYDRYGLMNRFYQIVKISGDTLHFSAYTERHELYDNLFIIKSINDNVQIEDKAISWPEILGVDSSRIHIKGDKRLKYEHKIEQRLKKHNR